ncbi:unnamed protein product, partial [Rotaria sp. Silwood2]
SDSFANVYSIEILWIDQIQQGLKQFKPTYIQHLINGNNSNYKIINKIEQMALIQTNNNQQYLAIILKSQINQQKVFLNFILFLFYFIKIKLILLGWISFP